MSVSNKKYFIKSGNEYAISTMSRSEWKQNVEILHDQDGNKWIASKIPIDDIHIHEEEPVAPPNLSALFFTNLMMLAMDGNQLPEALKFGLNSAYVEQSEWLKALQIKIWNYLAKINNEEELKVQINNLLANYGVQQKIDTEMKQTKNDSNLSIEDQKWLENFETFVQENLSKDILSVPMLADEFAMSESTLLRKIKRLTGLSPKKYLIEMRLNKACHLLDQGMCASVEIVGREIGYSDGRTFSRSFKQRFGKLPSEWGIN